MIKNIIFDLGNVILKDTPSVVLENLKISDEIYKIIKCKFFDNWNKLDLGKETLKEHLDNCGIDFTIDDEIREVLLNYYKYRPFNNEVIELMNNLKSNMYNIFILSNNNKEAYNYLVRLPIFEAVDGWIVSCDYNIIKPDKKIYIKLFENFNIKPEESFLIDDKAENIKVAKQVGMKGFILDLENQGIHELIESLKKNDIILETKSQ
ncbi:MAG: HAD-IA family hydrolase [Clostridia bacterium]|nr:HAD-IA family hydrolase [Clostridium sp.]